MPTPLPPPPNDTPLNSAGVPAPTWARWLQQLWEAATSNLRDSVRAYARAYSTSGQSISHNTLTVVAWNNTTEDTRSAISGLGTTSWKFTTPDAGRYLISARVGLNSSGTRGDVWLYLYKNGSQVSLLDFESGPLSSSYESVAGADIQRLEAGDYIDIRVQQNQSAGSAARTIDTSALASYVSIIRLVTDL